MAKKGLGRGLGAIFGDDSVTAANKKKAVKKKVSSAAAGSITEAVAAGNGDESDSDVSRETSTIRISMIEPNPDQPRKTFEEESLSELAESIKEHGVLQPIIVKQNGSMYSIIVGERRWRAARMAGLKEIPAIVREFNERESAEIALIENIQRENLSSVEEAKAFRSLIDDYGLTQEELAKRVSKNRTTITNSLRLLQLDDGILEMIETGALSAGHARALLSINGKKAQEKAAQEIVNDGLSVRDAEKLAKKYNSGADKKKTAKKGEEKDIYIESLENELTENMKLKVNIKTKGNSKGSVEIIFNSDDELELIADRIRALS